MSRITVLALRISGVFDVVLGLALYAAPRQMLSVVGIRDSSHPSYLVRVLGAHVAAIGAVSVSGASTKPVDDGLLSVLAASKIAGGLVLGTFGRRIAGGRVLPLVGLAEIVVGLVYVAAVVDPGTTRDDNR